MQVLSEDEWDSRFGWLRTQDDEYRLLSSSDSAPAYLRLLAIADPTYVWSQFDGADGGYEIRPGYSRIATGWYVCSSPWSDADLDIVVKLPGPDND